MIGATSFAAASVKITSTKAPALVNEEANMPMAMNRNGDSMHGVGLAEMQKRASGP